MKLKEMRMITQVRFRKVLMFLSLKVVHLHGVMMVLKTELQQQVILIRTILRAQMIIVT